MAKSGDFSPLSGAVGQVANIIGEIPAWWPKIGRIQKYFLTLRTMYDKVKYLSLSILLALSVAFDSNAAPDKAPVVENFIEGLESAQAYQAAGSDGLSYDFTVGGQAYKLVLLYYQSSVLAALQCPNGQRSVLYTEGQPAHKASCSVSKVQVGFDGKTEQKTNTYSVGVHDFTDDGQPELVLAVRNEAKTEVAIYIFKIGKNDYVSLGEMVYTGSEIRSCRVFRQTVTIKEAASSTLYTWTQHGSSFDFRASNGSTDPSSIVR